MAAQVAHGPATVPVGLETPPTWQSDASEFEQLGPARPVLLEQLARKRAHVALGRHVRVESGVEDRDVRRGSKDRPGDPDTLQIRRIVQRGEGRAALDPMMVLTFF